MVEEEDYDGSLGESVEFPFYLRAEGSGFGGGGDGLVPSAATGVEQGDGKGHK